MSNATFEGCFTVFEVQVDASDNFGGDGDRTSVIIKAPNRSLSLRTKSSRTQPYDLEGCVAFEAYGACERATLACALEWAAEQIREGASMNYLQQVRLDGVPYVFGDTENLDSQW